MKNPRARNKQKRRALRRNPVPPRRNPVPPLSALPTFALGEFFGGVLRGLFPEAIRKFEQEVSGHASTVPAITKPAELECAGCEGTCLCHHLGAPVGGVACPPECPNYGKRFDGCHKCDCATTTK